MTARPQLRLIDTTEARLRAEIDATVAQAETAAQEYGAALWWDGFAWGAALAALATFVAVLVAGRVL